MMRRQLAALTIVVLLCAAAPARAKSRPVVYAILFYSEECPACRELQQDTLGPLEQQYGEQLHITRVDVALAENYAWFLKAMQSRNVPPEEQKVPSLFVGDTRLLGSERIRAQLRGVVDAYLAAGGVLYPALPGIEVMAGSSAAVCAAAPCDPPDYRAPVASTPPGRESWPATVSSALWIFALLAVSIAVPAVLLLRGGKLALPFRAWRERCVPLLALAGALVAAYLTYTDLARVPAACAPGGGCSAVQSSPYAYVLGVPLALLGLLLYLAVLAVWLRGRLGAARGQARPALFALAAAGALFSLYLTGLEIWVIRAECPWCLASAALMAVMVWMTVP